MVRDLPTNSIQYTGTGDPNVVNQLFYDERDELIQRTDAAGASHVFAYDPMGRKTAQETYDVGQTTPMDFEYRYYNANGELNWIDGPRYNPEDYIFTITTARPSHDGNSLAFRSQEHGSGVQAPAGYNVYSQTFNQVRSAGQSHFKNRPAWCMIDQFMGRHLPSGADQAS